MAGSVESGKKAAKTLTKDNPNYYRIIGALGGKKGTTGGTYNRPDFASKIGALGGRRSKRGHTFLKEDDQGSHYIHRATGKVIVYKP